MNVDFKLFKVHRYHTSIVKKILYIQICEGLSAIMLFEICKNLFKLSAFFDVNNLIS